MSALLLIHTAFPGLCPHKQLRLIDDNFLYFILKVSFFNNVDQHIFRFLWLGLWHKLRAGPDPLAGIKDFV
jgi:hypothetical protein